MKGATPPPRSAARPVIETVPVGLRVQAKAVLVVGAGRIAARKARSYAQQGARLTVVAPHHGPDMDAVGAAVRHHREFRPEDLDGHWLAVSATGDPEVDGSVYRAAEERRIWCNAADDPEHCSMILPATVRSGDLTVSISSGGRSPAAASWLRRRIETLLDDDTLAVVDIAARVRDRMRAAGRATEVPGWAEVLDAEALQLVEAGRHDELEDRLNTAVEFGGAPEEVVR